MKSIENLLDRLIETLRAEISGPLPPAFDGMTKEETFRALCNIRPPLPATAEFLRMQDEYLTLTARERGIADFGTFEYSNGIALWQGDITRLNADAVVNACNRELLGCFSPLHNCIDNVIHSRAGVQVRLDCFALTRGKPEPNGRVRVTDAYNLPSRFIFHTVGPQVFGEPTDADRADLAGCYLSCLDKAYDMGLSSVAFCCLSTGVYGYPADEACEIAADTVRAWQGRTESRLRVVFDVFLDSDKILYEKKLGIRCGGGV